MDEKVKKYGIAAFFLLTVLVFGFSGTAAAENEIKVFVDGKPVAFSDQSPVLLNGYTFVPLRAIFEAMGAEVTWDAQNKTAVAFWGIDSLELKMGSQSCMTGSGKVIQLDVPAQILQGRVMVPLRAAAEAMGAAVEWEPVNSTIRITRDSSTQTLLYRNERFGYEIRIPEGFSVAQKAENGDGCTLRNEELNAVMRVYASYFPKTSGLNIEGMARFYRETNHLTDEKIVYHWCGITNLGMLWMDDKGCHFLQSYIEDGTEYTVVYDWTDDLNLYDRFYSNAQTLRVYGTEA